MGPRRKIRWLFVLALVALLLATWRGVTLIREHNLKWQVWFELPWATRLKSVELEAQRLWHRVAPPAPNRQRYAWIEAPHLQKAALEGAQWLLSAQWPSGRFRYWYNPREDAYSRPGQDNFLRQAGTGFGLYRLV